MTEDTARYRISAGFRAAIDEARQFVGRTAPNPPVGCALLDAQGEILTAAAHHQAGTHHAEARALAQARALGLTDQIHTAIVTLEPCNHTGRTPPCSEALLATPVRHVWIGCADPNPRVSGGGAARLTEAGIAVHWLGEGDALREPGGALAQNALRDDDIQYDASPASALPDAAALAAECRALIAPFLHWAATGRTWLTVKQALDASGSMVPPPGQNTFTSPVALHLAHELRRATDAIVTGTGTIRADLPGLGVRLLADHPERRRLLAICGQREHVPADWLEAAERRFALRFCADIRDVPGILADAGALWALVEAGPTLLAALRQHDIWDDWLTIAVQPDGTEQRRVERRHADTPLTLFTSEGALAGQQPASHISHSVQG